MFPIFSLLKFITQTTYAEEYNYELPHTLFSPSFSYFIFSPRTRGSVVATSRKVASSSPDEVIGFFSIDPILPVVLWPWGRLSLLQK
jgi:hypothetical protein